MTQGHFAVGSVFAGYVLNKLIGRGGMADVFLATQLSLRRRVALKLISSVYADDATFRERFIRESRHASAIDHPNIVPIYEAGEVDKTLFIAMRYIPGSDLRALLAGTTQLTPQRCITVLAQIANALDAAHSHGLVHRDVKPANVLLAPPEHDADEHAYLADFGLSKEIEGATRLTSTGQFVGTVDYIAPEQIEGARVDGRADVYSLGCVMYECLTGRRPFARDTESATIFAHLLDPPPQITHVRPELPSTLDAVIASALSKAPEGRQSTCRALVSAARRALQALPEQRAAAEHADSPRPRDGYAKPGPPPRPATRQPTWRLGKPPVR